MKKDITYILITLAIIVGISVAGNKLNTPNVETPSIQAEKNVAVTLRVEGLNLAEKYTVSANTSALTLLKEINKSNSDIKLETKEYSGLGVLVTTIGTKTNGQDDKFWQYYVNGIMPRIGADKYILQNEDSIEWRFAASEF